MVTGLRNVAGFAEYVPLGGTSASSPVTAGVATLTPELWSKML